jgi:glycosyltransferase involved in cell wall biosynthesis
MPDISNPLFSIVIPTHNRSHLVCEAIESALSQTLTDFELIIVDDASMDDTMERLCEFNDGRIKVISRKSQGGPSTARNEGAQTATGKWLAFLDSDDLWLPGKLQAQADYFKSNPQILICQTEETWIRNDCEVKPQKKHRKEGGFIFPRALKLCLVSPSAVALERNLFIDSGGFDEELPAAEDFDLWLRLLHNRPIGLVEESLVIKRAGEWSQLSFTTQAIDRYRIRAIEKILESDELSKENFELARKELKIKCEIYIIGCNKRGRVEEAEHYRELIKKYKSISI